jgi:nucleoside-diphosphate-sugar epimerase
MLFNSYAFRFVYLPFVLLGCTCPFYCAHSFLRCARVVLTAKARDSIDDMATKVIITGGGGFIGSNLAHLLVQERYDVHLVDRDFGFRATLLPHETKRHSVSILDTAALQEIFQDGDIVFHTAAIPRAPYSIEHPVETTQQNVTGTVSVLTAAAGAKVRRVVHSSSGSSYGAQDTLPFVETMICDPAHPYGLQKYVSELFARLWSSVYKIETVSLRYFNVYGPGLDPNGPYALAIGQFLMARKGNTPITIFGDGTITRDFTHVSDVARANLLAAMSTNVGRGEVMNIGSGHKITIRKLADMFGGEILYGPPRIEAHDALADIRKAKELIGWEPSIFVEEGVAQLKKEWGLA